MACGLADDMLSTTLLATTAPILVAPAMNVHMYEHPAVQANMQTLRERGVHFIEPGVGQLACGYVGRGRLAEPEEIYAEIVRLMMPDRLWPAVSVLVTAGGTLDASIPCAISPMIPRARWAMLLHRLHKRWGLRSP